MAGLRGQLFQIEKLGPSVPLPKGVHIVHVAHDPTSGCGEVRPVQAMQEGGAGKALVNVPHAGLDEPAEQELMPALGDLHGAKLASPIVNILEQVPADGAKVGELEAPGRDTFGCPLGDKLPL